MDSLHPDKHQAQMMNFQNKVKQHHAPYNRIKKMTRIKILILNPC